MPDSDSLLQLFESTKALYSDLRSEMENDERYVTGDYGDTFLPDDWDDEGLQAIITSTAYDAVENAANHILTTPHISVPARPMKDSKEAAEELAERFRIFLDLWWRRVEEDQGDPFGKGRKHIIKGRLILKKTINWELLPDPRRPMRHDVTATSGAARSSGWGASTSSGTTSSCHRSRSTRIWRSPGTPPTSLKRRQCWRNRVLACSPTMKTWPRKTRPVKCN